MTTTTLGSRARTPRSASRGRVRLRRTAIALLTTLLAVIGITAVAGPAAAATCHGSTCNGKNPQTSGCAADAITSTYDNNGIELRYSRVCDAYWARDTTSHTLWNYHFDVERQCTFAATTAGLVPSEPRCPTSATAYQSSPGCDNGCYTNMLSLASLSYVHMRVCSDINGGGHPSCSPYRPS